MSGTYTDSVAAEVRAHMGRQKVTQREIAAAIGKSQTAAYRRLNGSQPFDVAELEAIANLLGVPVSEFLPGAAS